jgi:hypothetical protein
MGFTVLHGAPGCSVLRWVAELCWPSDVPVPFLCGSSFGWVPPPLLSPELQGQCTSACHSWRRAWPVRQTGRGGVEAAQVWRGGRHGPGQHSRRPRWHAVWGIALCRWTTTADTPSGTSAVGGMKQGAPVRLAIYLEARLHFPRFPRSTCLCVPIWRPSLRGSA